MSFESLKKCFYAFCSVVNKCYGDNHLNRIPEDSELALIEQKFSYSLFRSCIGSLDWMHVHWKNCPKGREGQYHNPRAGILGSIQVEAACDMDLYCWHVHCGPPGTKNDIPVMESSPLILSIRNGQRNMKLENVYRINGRVENRHLHYWQMESTPNGDFYQAKSCTIKWERTANDCDAGESAQGCPTVTWSPAR